MLGLISSMPLGPINLTLISIALRMETRRCLATSMAVAVVDGCYAFAAVSALSILHRSFLLRSYIELAGALAVLAYGLYLAFYGTTLPLAPSRSILPSRYRNLSLGALTGVALYVSNPSFIVFWLSAAGALHSWISATAPLGNRLFFGAGVVAGTASWFGILLYVVRNASARVSPVVLRGFSVLSSCVLIGLGGYVVVKRLSGIL